MKARHNAELLPIECKYLQAGLCSGGCFVQQCSAFSTLKICSIDAAAIWVSRRPYMLVLGHLTVLRDGILLSLTVDPSTSG